MSEPLAYIVTGALMNCDKGVAIMPFKTNHRTTTVDGIIAANESDKVPLVNIPSFVMCTVGNVPCTPIPVAGRASGSVWLKTGDEFATVAGLPPVLFRSCMTCSKGGEISFLTTGQIPMSEMDPTGELQDQIDEINEQAEEMRDEYERAENSIGESGLIEGFIPVWGSGRDAIANFQQGNIGWGLFNTGMVVVDVFTLGGSSLVKGGVRAGVKMTIKEFAEGLAKKLATLTALKLAAKEAIERGFRETLERLAIRGRKLVTACFPAGTPVAVEGGFKNIEDIQVGDLVWSYNPDTLETGLKEVVDTHENTVDSTIQLTIGEEVIETTATHPFYTEEGWKEAGRLTTEDKIKSKSGAWEQIKAINFSTISKKVYNFTVKDWHTYFVGAFAWLVHNICKAGLLAKLGDDYPNITKFLDEVTDPDMINRIDDLTPDELGKLDDLLKYQKSKDLRSTTVTKNIGGKDISVKYDEYGFPDFTPHASSKNHVFTSNTLTGGSTDMTKANGWLIDKYGADNFRRHGSAIDIKDANGNWVRHTWHHHQDGRSMFPVPSAIHNVGRGNHGFSHSGGAAVIKRGLQDLFTGPNF